VIKDPVTAAGGPRSPGPAPDQLPGRVERRRPQVITVAVGGGRPGRSARGTPRHRRRSFLSLVLKPTVNRWANIVLPILYIVSVVASVIGGSAYFYFLSVVESALLLLIIRYAWTWPKQEGIARSR
jgi:hypothetical protein